MGVTKESFGTTKDGHEISQYTITNAGLTACVIDFGAILTKLYVPDAKGEIKDIVLGFESLDRYELNPDFFGATVGPSANRIGKAAFVMDGEAYHLPINDGENNLHTDAALGAHKKVWNAEILTNGVTFTVEIPDGECGLPGNRTLSVTYEITEEKGLRIHYHVTSDAKTLVNMTNHSYFNLAGHDHLSIAKQRLTLFCSHFTPVVAGAIPTGEIKAVAGTPLDFTSEKEIGQDIEQDYLQLSLVGGFDHNFVADAEQDGKQHKIATALDPESGRAMDVYTDLPGVQFYAGNFVNDPDGKDGVDYGKRAAFCLETQYFPDTPNHDHFPQAFFGPDKEYDTVTEYRFYTV